MQGGSRIALVVAFAFGALVMDPRGGGKLAEADVQAGLWLGRVDTTTRDGSAFRTWSSDAETGYVLSRLDIDVSLGTSRWRLHGAGTAPAGAKGVAATSYLVGATSYEWVVYVASDGKLNFGEVIDDGPITWTAIDPPLDRTLTGHIAAITFVQGANRYILVGATTTSGHLYRFVGFLPSLFGGWTNSSGALTWTTDSQLAVSTNPSGTIASVFAEHTPGAEKLGMIRWNGSTWSTNNLGSPAGRRVCRSIASAQMSPSGLSGDERVLVACTPHDAITGVDLAIATSYSSTNFTWSTYDTTNFYQTIVAVTRPNSQLNSSKRIDTYGSQLFSGALIKGVYTGSSYTVATIGPSPDGGGIWGGMGAVPFATTSRAFFVGMPGGRGYIYSRYGGRTSNEPQNYRAMGDYGWFSLPGSTVDHFAEGTMAIWQGTTAATVINRPGEGGVNDWPQVFLLYSVNEGKTQRLPVQVPNTVTSQQLGTVTYPYVSDPTTVVTKERRVYSVQLGVDIDECSARALPMARSLTLYFVTTTPATFPTLSTPVAIQAAVGLSLDHGYANIQHRIGQPDLIHVAWMKIEERGAHLQYSAILDGPNPSPTSPLDITLPGNGAPPRLTASDSGRVIVYWPYPGTPHSVRFCELWDKVGSDGLPDTCCKNNGSTCGPDLGWQEVDVGPPPNPLAWSTRADLGPFATQNSYIQDKYPISMAISESGDTLYYCFDRLEQTGPGAGELQDSLCTTGSRDPVTGIWSWNVAPVALVGVVDDGKDQFLPEVALTQEANGYVLGRETAIVTFHDRSQDPNNRYYQVKKTVSLDQMATVFPARAMFGGISSDPEYLPRHCFHPGARFIGDYAGIRGDILHAQSLSVTVWVSGTVGTAVYSNFNGLGYWEN